MGESGCAHHYVRVVGPGTFLIHDGIIVSSAVDFDKGIEFIAAGKVRDIGLEMEIGDSETRPELEVALVDGLVGAFGGVCVVGEIVVDGIVADDELSGRRDIARVKGEDACSHISYQVPQTCKTGLTCNNHLFPVDLA